MILAGWKDVVLYRIGRLDRGARLDDEALLDATYVPALDVDSAR